MRLVIVGATGGTGRELLRQALAAHTVTAVVRNPDAVSERSATLTVVRGDVTDARSLKPLFAGHDAVLSALGARGLGRTTLYSDSGRAIVEAMESCGVRRFIAVTSVGIQDSPRLDFVYRWVLRPLVFRNLYVDMQRFEQIVEASTLDWTLLRPPRLTSGPRTGRYRASPVLFTGADTLSRANLADAMLAQLDPVRAARGGLFVAD